MGQFKQMPKMKTTEPSVILKLKKGGHVNSKLTEKGENGFSAMSDNPKYRESMEAESGNAPKKPSMADRKKAMNPNFKDGGKIPKMGMGGDMAAMVKRFQDQAAQKKISQAQSVPTPDKPKIIQQLGRAPSMGNTGGGSGIFNAASKAVSGLSKAPQAIIKGGSGMLGNIAKTAQSASPFGGIGKALSGSSLKKMFRFKEGGMMNGGDMSQDKAMVKKAFKQHDAQEHMGGKGTKLSLKTGGVTKGAGGYKTGGVALSDGGFKNGGAALKKAFATGGNVNDEGAAVKMPRRPVSRPVANTMQSGTFARGGKVEKEEKPNLRLVKTHTGPGGHVAKTYKDKDWGEYRTKFFTPEGKHMTASDNHTDDRNDAFDTAQSQVNKGYRHGGMAKKFDDGGSESDKKYTVKNPKAVSDKASRELEDALNPIDMVKELAGKAKDYFTPPAGSVTKTEKSVTVAPGKRYGGSAC